MEIIIGFIVLFGLLFVGVPIAFGMALVGIVGLTYVVGFEPAARQVGQMAMDTPMIFTFSVLPLFLLMGNLISRSGLSQDLFVASNKFVGHFRGGLAMATVLACGGFSAVSGSSFATAATMAPIAIPSMRRHGYRDGLATGSVAAGGTLGILIPPSIVLVIYGSLTETDIGALFIAGIIPGIVGIALYIAAIWVIGMVNPAAAPAAPKASWTERLVSLKGVWGVVALFALVMGGIYFGVFSPTEAAGIGAVGALVFALIRRTISLREYFEIFVETAHTTTALLALVIGAVIFAAFVNLAGLPNQLSEFIIRLEFGPWQVIMVILIIYLILGCFLEAFSMILLTVPIFAPIIVSLGFDLIWFGIIVVIVVEIGLITPPIGMNVFVLKSVMRDIETATIFRGVAPFVAAGIIRLAILLPFPSIILFLPGQMLS